MHGRTSSTAHRDEAVASYLEDVGAQVRERREQQALSQAELAARAGISERCLRKLEAGDNAELRPCALVALALGLAPEDLGCPAGLSGGVARVALAHLGIGASRQ